MKVGFIAGRDLRDARLNLEKTLLVEKRPDGAHDLPRASRNGFRSTCRAGDHHGEWLVRSCRHCCAQRGWRLQSKCDQ